jgi:DNA repair photolyase
MGKEQGQAARKGRGALSNRDGRYEALSHETFDDGWEAEAEKQPRRTVVLADRTRKLIARNDSPDVPFDRSINPYRGCEHGCVYCYARPSHAYLGLSPGLDFETRIFAKYDAATALRDELSKPGYKPAVIAIGANTDPYQPIERRLEITRQTLALLAETRHPFALITKSALVLRDLDLIAPMAADGLAKIYVSVTTLDPLLARRMEPRAAQPGRRLAAIRGLAEAGVPTGVLAAPMIPALNDSELETILEAAKAEGAESASYVLLRLPLEIKGLFEEWLEAHYPDRKARVLQLLRETRGGQLYNPTWNKRMTGEGPYAQLLKQRFDLAVRRLALNRRDWDLDISRFEAPAKDQRQGTLF